MDMELADRRNCNRAAVDFRGGGGHKFVSIIINHSVHLLLAQFTYSYLERRAIFIYSCLPLARGCS